MLEIRAIASRKRHGSPFMNASRLLRALATVCMSGVAVGALSPAAHAQSARFTLRAEPDVIAANGISTTSIFVQVPNSRGAITSTPTVRFATTAGTIENQATLTDGVARVLLRSSSTPGTAVVTAFIGSSREVITVEFSAQNEIADRYLEVAAPYVAYGQGAGIITSAGKCQFDFGDTHIESDVRLDVDLYTERVWAQGNKNGVTIRQGRGARAKTLRGDRLFFDLQKRTGVIRRADGDSSGGAGGARQEFFGSDFAALPPREPTAPAITAAPQEPNALQTPNVPAVAPAAGQFLGDGINNDAPRDLLDNRQAAADALAQSGAVAAKIGEQNVRAAPAPNDETAEIKPNDTEVKPNDTEVKPNDTEVKPNDTEVKPNDTDVVPANTNVVPNDTDVKLADTDVKLADTDVVLANTDVKLADTDVVLANTDVKLADTDVKLADTDVVLADTVRAANGAVDGENAPVFPANSSDVTASRGPNAPGNTRTQSNPLVSQPRAASDGAGDGASDGGGAPTILPDLPAYKPLPDGGPEPRVIELPPPAFDVANGYWVAARRLRVFPRSEIQFQRATIYFNGGKAFKAPIYVLPLDGSFNPTTDLFAFNSAGGLSVRFPFYYQADRGGTGALFVRNEPGNGFSPNRRGLSLELDQQYAFSSRSRGRFGVDQIGNGPVNINLQHQLELNPTTHASFFVNVPRQSNLFARAALTKDLRAAQIGLETFYDAPQNQSGVTRGQFYARLRPRRIGKSGLTYSVSANLLAISRLTTTRYVPGAGTGGGIGLPGQSDNSPQFIRESRSLVGQTLSGSLQAPLLQPWRGAQLTGSLLTTAYNYSDGRRGIAPGVTLGYAQRVGSRASFRLDYTYDRSAIGLYGATGANFTNYISASLDAQLLPKLGVSTFLSKSLADQSLYGSTDVSYRISDKWRAGVFADYSSFASADAINYGWSLGRAVGPREVSVNYDAVRSKIYFQVGTARY